MASLSRRQNPLVLLVEDDAGLREAVVKGLTKAGYQVAAAGSRREAVRAAHDLNPDAVVMDVLLPDGEGPVAAREIREPGRARRRPGALRHRQGAGRGGGLPLPRAGALQALHLPSTGGVGARPGPAAGTGSGSRIRRASPVT